MTEWCVLYFCEGDRDFEVADHADEGFLAGQDWQPCDVFVHEYASGVDDAVVGGGGDDVGLHDGGDGDPGCDEREEVGFGDDADEAVVVEDGEHGGPGLADGAEDVLDVVVGGDGRDVFFGGAGGVKSGGGDGAFAGGAELVRDGVVGDDADEGFAVDDGEFGDGVFLHQSEDVRQAIVFPYGDNLSGHDVFNFHSEVLQGDG